MTQDGNDPYHQVIGNQPPLDLPWHINLCRLRVRNSSTEHSAFAPAGTKGINVPRKFSYFYKGSSYEFVADPSVTDFLIESDKAKKLVRARKPEDAISIFLALANDEMATIRQESFALEQAKKLARGVQE